MSRALATFGLLATILALPACDNPACVFSEGGCQVPDPTDPGSGGLGSAPAGTPTEGVWLAPTLPVFEAFAPSSTDVHPQSPIVLRFNESLNASSLGGAFELFDATLGQNINVINPPPLAGDGRLVILSPLTPLPSGSTIEIFASEGAQITDLQGQVYSGPANGFLGSFGIGTQFTDIPAIIATWPLDLSTNQSDLSQVTVVFDRTMDAASFSTSSWQVRADGIEPSPNPDPEPLRVGQGPVTATLDSVWNWSSESTAGQRVSFGTAATVEVTLSPSGSTLQAPGLPTNFDLPATLLTFDVGDFSAPVRAFKPFSPTDAIGSSDLEGSSPILQVELAEPAQVGDVLELYLFGTDSAEDEEVALFRSITVAAPSALLDVFPADLALIDTTVSPDPLLADGEVRIATVLVRGDFASAARLADADETTDGIQPFLLDTKSPELLGLGTGGPGMTTFVSDQRDLVLVARANEEPGGARVSTSAGNNFIGAEVPQTVASGTTGLFIAAPVTIGQLVPDAPPLAFQLEISDRAGNISTPVAGVFEQRGAVGPAPILPDATLTVKVYDRRTLEVLEDVRVMTHQLDSGTLTELAVALTDANGEVTLAASLTAETVVTADLGGYDLFTFQGVPVNSIHLPLTRANDAPGMVSGEVSSDILQGNIAQLFSTVADSRAGLFDPRLIPVDACELDPADVDLSCPYGPGIIQPGRLGMQSAFSVEAAINPAAFTALGFLRAYAFAAPLLPFLPGAPGVGGDLAIGQLLALQDTENQPIEVDPQVLSRGASVGLGTVSTPPVITVEGLAPGIGDPVPVGVGLGPMLNANQWSVLAAIPGVVDGIDNGGGDELGELIQRGTFGADLVLRADVTDDGGIQLGHRRLLSQLGPILFLGAAPQFQSPGIGGASGGFPFELDVADVLRDSQGLDGLFRAYVVDSAGRGWELWRLDPPDGSPDGARFEVPDIGTVGLGGNSLSAGAATCRVSYYAWLAFDRNSFLWSDVDRLPEVYGTTPAESFTLN